MGNIAIAFVNHKVRKILVRIYDLCIVTALMVFSSEQIVAVHHGYSNLVVEISNNRFLRFDRRFGKQIINEWRLICISRKVTQEKCFHLPGAYKKKFLGLSFLVIPKYKEFDSSALRNTLIKKYIEHPMPDNQSARQKFDYRYIEAAHKNLMKSQIYLRLEIPPHWNWTSLLSNEHLTLRVVHGDLNIGNIFFNDKDDSLIFIDLDCMNFSGIREFDYIDYVLSFSPNRGWLDQLWVLTSEDKYQEMFVKFTLPQEAFRLIYFYLLQRIGQDFLKFGNDGYFKDPKNVIRIIELMLSKLT